MSVLRAMRQPTVRQVPVAHTTKRNITIGSGMPANQHSYTPPVSESWHTKSTPTATDTLSM